jgi:tRNA modification GTPase
MGPQAGVEETIVAISSALTPARRGVVRLSGLAALRVAERIGVTAASTSRAHCIDTSVGLDPPLGHIPVRALIWPTGRSYTGQPSLELHTFGSLPILSAIVEAATHAGARPARPGEFTLRAFLAGRLDLTQAEAVLGVIDAESRGSLDDALRQLAGNLSRPLEFLRDQLLDLLADVEAGLDFVDEDIEFISDTDLTQRLTAILQAIQTTRRQLMERKRDQAEIIVTLRGLPNAGKSSLVNALSGDEAAIVAGQAGTTRDVIRVPATIGGHSVVLTDTAGIETVSGDTPLEQISRLAQEHARRSGREADIRLWCVDFSDPRRQETCRAVQAFAEDKRRETIDLWVATKCDAAESVAGDRSPPSPWIPASTRTAGGLKSLIDTLTAALASFDQVEHHSVASTAARCSASLRAAETAIRTALRYVVDQQGHEYVASELRLAAHSLGEVTGTVYTDDVLDRVFSRFCIGK